MNSLDVEVREKAQANVKTNVKMIDVMSEYWKIADLYRIWVRFLMKINKRMPLVLEGEPKHSSIAALTSFRTNAAHTRTSILEFNGPLRPDGDGYVRPGEECDLRAGDENFATEPQSRALMDDDQIISPGGHRHDASTATNMGPLSHSWDCDDGVDSNRSNAQYGPEPLSFLGVSGPEQLDVDYQNQETFNPFFDLQPLNLDYFDTQQIASNAQVHLL
jgi:hypothetical protein